MRRQFLKQLMMSIAAVSILGAQPEIRVDKEAEERNRIAELIAKLDGSDGSMALAC